MTVRESIVRAFLNLNIFARTPNVEKKTVEELEIHKDLLDTGEDIIKSEPLIDKSFPTLLFGSKKFKE